MISHHMRQAAGDNKNAEANEHPIERADHAAYEQN